jgi:predicted NBD/HSP70 family sugar kinase
MPTRSAATQDDLRRHNLARLLRRLHERGAASRSELVAFTGLNRSTVGVLVSELAEVGLVYEGAGSAGQVGRPSLVVQPEPTSAVVVAFDLRVERTIVALVGLSGDVLMRKEQSHKRTSYTPEAAVKNVVGLVGTVLAKAPRASSWVGVGFGVPGIVDHLDGRVRLAPNLGWVDVPLGDMVRDALIAEFGYSPRVVVGNDADLGAIAEQARGVGLHSRNVIYVSGEVGIGGGIIIDGRPMAGAGGYGGEIGHMMVNPNGAICRCGAQGCWETLIGRDAVVNASGLGDQAEMADVIAAASGGDARAQAAVEEAGTWLGIGLANLVNLFNPEVIVLGGHLRLLFPMVSSTVLRRVHLALPATREQVRVEVPALNGDSTLIGAAELAFEALLSDPIEVLARAHHAAAS